MKNVITLKMLIMFCLLIPEIVVAGNYNDFEINLTLNTSIVLKPHPIIFVHGRNIDHDYAYKYWKGDNPKDYTCMMQILNEGYGSYTVGNLECTYKTVLSSTNGDTKKIYNFTYYGNNCGAVGSNGNLLPVSRDDVPYIKESYMGRLSYGSFAQRLSEFIDKVLLATGANKVDIVAHSLGGLVARSSIKWYGCDTKVHKLLMIGTPNCGIHGPTPFSNLIGGSEGYKDGENLELDGGIVFYDVTTGEKDAYAHLLNKGDWAKGVRYATIAGNRKEPNIPSFMQSDDILVNTEWVKLDGADFNAVYYASHGTADIKFPRGVGHFSHPNGANSLTACLYTTEFIKNWIINDSVEHNGATAGDNNFVYPNPWKSNAAGHDRCHFRFDINDYNKALVVRTDMYNIVPELIETKEFPIYRYNKDITGDPVYSNNINNYASGWGYFFYIRVYDMNGLIWGGQTKSNNKLAIIK